MHPPPLRGSGCRFCWRTSAGCSASPTCSVTLREEILAVVSKHIVLDPDKVIVKLERGKTVSTLEVDIEVPEQFRQGRRPARGAWPADAAHR